MNPPLKVSAVRSARTGAAPEPSTADAPTAPASPKTEKLDYFGPPRRKPSSAANKRIPVQDRMFSQRIFPHLRHLPGSGFMGMLAGKGVKALSASNYKFVQNELRPYCRDGQCATFYAGSTPVIYVPNGEDMKELNKHQGCYTQRTQFGTSGEFVGERNVIQADLRADDSALRHRYSEALRAITMTTGNKFTMEDFYRGITQEIESMVEDKVGTEFNLDDFAHVGAMDLGGKMLLGTEKTRPSDLIKGNVGYLNLVKDFSSRMPAPKDGVVNHLLRTVGLKGRHLDLEKERDDFSDYILALLENNFSHILDPMQKNCPLRAKWQTKDYFGARDREQFEFPRSWEEFKNFPEGKSDAVKAKFRDLLIDQAFLQIVSSETTAQALNFGIREMADRRDWLLTIRQEVEDLAKHGKTLEDIQPEDMSTLLPNLSHFVTETLRLYTPAPLISWEVKKAVTVPVGGQDTTLLPGTVLLFDQENSNHLALERGDEFHPERYAHRPGFDFKTYLKELPTEFRSFSGGARPCPGREAAAMELAKMLAVVSKYDISTPGQEVSMARSGRESLRADQDLRIRFDRPSAVAVA